MKKEEADNNLEGHAIAWIYFRAASGGAIDDRGARFSHWSKLHKGAPDAAYDPVTGAISGHALCGPLPSKSECCGFESGQALHRKRFPGRGPRNKERGLVRCVRCW